MLIDFTVVSGHWLVACALAGCLGTAKNSYMHHNAKTARARFHWACLCSPVKTLLKCFPYSNLGGLEITFMKYLVNVPFFLNLVFI